MKATEVFGMIDDIFAYMNTARAVIAGAEGAIQRLLTIARDASETGREELTEGEIRVLTVARKEAISKADRVLADLKAQAAALGIDDPPPLPDHTPNSGGEDPAA